MSKVYANPFHWGSFVSGNHYLARPLEQEHLSNAIEKQVHLVISGQRGTGKTSILKHALLNSRSIPSIYMDLSFVTSREDLINLLLDAFEKSFPEEKTAERTKSLRPQKGGVSFAPVIDLWYNKVKQNSQKFTFVWDEFHHLVKLKDGILEELKQNLRDRRRITHIVASHREDILDDIFGNRQDPFFPRIEKLTIKHIDQKAFNRFLTQRFRRMGLSDFDLADAVLTFTDGHPQITQKFAHALAELWLEGSSTRLMERTLHKILESHDHIFTAWWDSFGLNEKRLLLGLASGYSRPTELAFIKKFKLSATSTAHNTVLKMLREGWLINRDEGYHIYNPLLLKWLQLGKGLS